MRRLRTWRWRSLNLDSLRTKPDSSFLLVIVGNHRNNNCSATPCFKKKNQVIYISFLLCRIIRKEGFQAVWRRMRAPNPARDSIPPSSKEKQVCESWNENSKPKQKFGQGVELTSRVRLSVPHLRSATRRDLPPTVIHNFCTFRSNAFEPFKSAQR